MDGLFSSENLECPKAWEVEKVVGLTSFVIIHVFIASFSPPQGERNQMVNAKFTRPLNAIPMSSPERGGELVRRICQLSVAKKLERET